MKKWITVFFWLNIALAGHAQIGLQINDTQLLRTEKIAIQPVPKAGMLTIVPKATESKYAAQENQPTWSFSESNVYDAHFGFFCKVEVKLDKVTSMPLRFRLGNLDYVNYLEK